MVGGKVTSSALDGSRVTSAAPSDGLDPAATAAAAVQDILGNAVFRIRIISETNT